MYDTRIIRGQNSGVNRYKTALYWNEKFAAKFDKGGRGSAFLGMQPGLPNDYWDKGSRVLAPFTAFQQSPLANIVEVRIAKSIKPKDLKGIHSEEYLQNVNVIPKSVRGKRERAALLAAGSVRSLIRHVAHGKIRNGYALIRPAGHHAEYNAGGGGCVLANGVIAAKEALRMGMSRVAIVDIDAHWGNSQMHAFYDSPQVLTISLHQDINFKPGFGGIDALGVNDGKGCNINIPMAFGSGGAAYQMAFDRVVLPALDRYAPDMIILLAGYDASYIDPAARLALHSRNYFEISRSLRQFADRNCQGQIAVIHEGGYARSYTSVCFLKILEGLVGDSEITTDPFLAVWGEKFASVVPDKTAGNIDTLAISIDGVPGR